MPNLEVYMRKKRLSAILTLIGVCAFVVFGNSTEFFQRALAVLQVDSLANVLNSKDRAMDVIRKAGHPQRPTSRERPVSNSTKRPEGMLWNILFDFTRKIENKANEMAAQSGNGSLYSEYFTRQGHLMPEQSSFLKQKAAQYFEEIDPIEQSGKDLLEQLKNESSSDPKSDRNASGKATRLKELQKQKDDIGLRYRDELKESFGAESFSNFQSFLQTEFSDGAVSGTHRGKCSALCYCDLRCKYPAAP